MHRFILLSLTSLLVTACGGDVAEPVERVRAVKTILVADRASGQLRKFPGTLEPVDNSVLSFEVSGLVQEVDVTAGDRFEEGQVLARMDKQPFELNVESAQAALSRAQAQLEEKKSAYEREQRIQAQEAGATTQRAVDQARAAYESVRQTVSYSRAQLDLARRDLRNTELRAPFDGVVSQRLVEAFEEIGRGQPVFDVFVEGAMEAAVAIPENMIDEVYLGLKGEVRVPGRDQVYQAAVSEIGSAATAANAFPVKATITDPSEDLRPGMTAELALQFTLDDDGQSGYLVPLRALVPGVASDDRHVFVYDTETAVVRKTPIQEAGLLGDRVIITRGVNPGDVVVVAGVPFLRDGQRVTLMNPAHGG
ncbi:MAG: efflux RND transporter periplasmic adaptor subunit [Pseudomonadota bacterium]